MSGARALAGAAAVAALTLALAPDVLGPAALRAGALALVLGFAPGWLAARRLIPERDRALRAALGIALSPFLTAAPAALLMLAGLGLQATARSIAIAVAVLCIAEAVLGGRPRGAAPVPGGAPVGDGGGPAARATGGRDRADIFIALGLTAVVAALHALNPALAGRSDGAFHAAVTLAVGRGGIPPADPFFAGIPLGYFWGAHLWAALWLALAGPVAVWTPLVMLDLLALLAMLLGVAWLARRLGGGRRAVALAMGLALAGSAPFAWLGIAARALAGEVRGLDELRRLITNGVDGALRAMSTGLLHPSLVLPADKFVVLGSFGAGLALAALWACALVRLLAPQAIPTPAPRRDALALGLITAAALFLHPIVGLTLAVGGAAAATVAERGRARTLLIVLGVVVPVLALAPYVFGLGSHSGTTGIGNPLRSLLTLLYGGALVLPAAYAALVTIVRTRPADAAPARALLAAAAALALAGLVGRLQGDNQSKLFNLLFLIVSAPAALGWLALYARFGRGARRALAAVVALAVLPTLAVCAWAYACERGQNAYSYRAPVGAEAAALAWARAALPARAVLVDPEIELRGAGTLPVAADRPLLWGGSFMAAKWGYAPAELERRRRVAEALTAGTPLEGDDARFARALGGPLVLVARARAAEAPDAFARRIADASTRFERLDPGLAVAFLAWRGER